MERFATRSFRARRIRLLVYALALVGLTAGAPERVEAQQIDNSQNVAGTLGFDVSHAYFFRGIRQERDGIVFQPYGDLQWALWRDDDTSGINSVDFKLGLWNSLHSGPTGSDSGADTVRAWYESDFFAAFLMGFGDTWAADLTYTSYMSPNGTFNSIQEISFGLSKDDSALLGRFSLVPRVRLAIEIDGNRDGGRAGSEGVYLEVGLEPTFGLEPGGNVGISFPMIFGFSMSDYYQGTFEDVEVSSGFGFFDIGADLTFPMPMPAGYGDWELTGGFHVLSLGEFNKLVNDGDGVQVLAMFGLSTSY